MVGVLRWLRSERDPKVIWGFIVAPLGVIASGLSIVALLEGVIGWLLLGLLLLVPAAVLATVQLQQRRRTAVERMAELMSNLALAVAEVQKAPDEDIVAKLDGAAGCAYDAVAAVTRGDFQACVFGLPKPTDSLRPCCRARNWSEKEFPRSGGRAVHIGLASLTSSSGLRNFLVSCVTQDIVAAIPDVDRPDKGDAVLAAHLQEEWPSAKSFVFVPLRPDNNILGALVLRSRDHGHFGPVESHVGLYVAGILSVGLADAVRRAGWERLLSGPSPIDPTVRTMMQGGEETAS